MYSWCFYSFLVTKDQCHRLTRCWSQIGPPLTLCCPYLLQQDEHHTWLSFWNALLFFVRTEMRIKDNKLLETSSCLWAHPFPPSLYSFKPNSPTPPEGKNKRVIAQWEGSLVLCVSGTKPNTQLTLPQTTKGTYSRLWPWFPKEEQRRKCVVECYLQHQTHTLAANTSFIAAGTSVITAAHMHARLTLMEGSSLCKNVTWCPLRLMGQCYMSKWADLVSVLWCVQLNQPFLHLHINAV